MLRRSLAPFILLVVSPAAMAINNRSAVSVTGVDTNSCSVASPCRSFGAALAATIDGGEIVALDSAGYGAFSIAQSVTVTGAPGVHAAITATFGDAIAVTAGQRVAIGNLYMLGNQLGSNGIHNTGAAFLHVFNSFIQGFVSHGVWSTNSSAYTVVEHCTVDSNNTGIEIDQETGSVDNCSINSNTTGVYYSGGPALVGGNVTLTTFRFNGTAMQVLSSGGSDIIIDRCSMTVNSDGLVVFGSGNLPAIVLLTNNVIDSVTASGNYLLDTAGNNTLRFVTGTLSSLPLQ